MHAPLLGLALPLTLIISVALRAADLTADPPTTSTANPTSYNLWNGRDLDGWVLVNTPPETWTIQDNLLVCSGRPTGEIRTRRMYQNFILELDWRHMVPGGNAGIFVWADDITARGVPFHRSIEVQVLENAYGNAPSHTTHGDIFPIHGARMTPVNGRGGDRAFPTEERSLPSPQWNHYKITCLNGSIALEVNGKLVTQGKDAIPRKGYICLESEGGTVHYRHVRITELPATEISPDQIAHADRGYRSIYSGLDLRGWEVGQHGREHWQVHDWQLAFDGKINPSDARLALSPFPAAPSVIGFSFDFQRGSDFRGLTVQWSQPQGTPAVAGTGELIIDGNDQRWQGLLAAGNGWNRCVGTVESGMLTVTLNGQAVVTGQPSATIDGFALLPNGAQKFANLYLQQPADR